MSEREEWRSDATGGECCWRNCTTFEGCGVGLESIFGDWKRTLGVSAFNGVLGSLREHSLLRFPGREFCECHPGVEGELLGACAE